tara:strand:- start:197 stop:466 length:270 start_codon:yes stop_codon:yes gene_type:complete
VLLYIIQIPNLFLSYFAKNPQKKTGAFWVYFDVFCIKNDARSFKLEGFQFKLEGFLSKTLKLKLKNPQVITYFCNKILLKFFRDNYIPI